jgi:regulator of protease activity HflC (stomatin/prohibitin superfamily)
MIANVVDALLANLGALIPAKIVRSYQRGVKFRWGVDVAELGAGLHWFWPLAESIEVKEVVEEVTNLPTQTVTTADGHAVTFSVNIAYEVQDARAYWTTVQDFDASLSAAAMTYLARELRERSWADLYGEQRKIESGLTRSLAQKLSRWGVRIVDVGITDLARARPIRLYNG